MVKLQLDEKSGFFYKGDDGLTYSLNHDSQTAKLCNGDANATVADIPCEVMLDDKVYSVTTIMSHCMSQCTMLEKVIIPPSIELIEWYAFTLFDGAYPKGDCKLKQVIFNGCKNLKINCSLSLERADYDSLETLLSITGADYSNHEVYIAGQKLTDLIVPEGITKVSESALRNVSSLCTVSLPASIKFIGYTAFQECNNLVSINLPEGLETIGSGAFRLCTSLKQIELPVSIKKLGTSIFDMCVNLSMATLPEGLTNVPNKTFFGCSSLSTVNIPSSVIGIGEKAFYGCRNLAELQIPENLQTIGDYAFAFMPIKEITLPQSLVSVGEFVFEACGQLANVFSKIMNPTKCEIKALEAPAKRGCEVTTVLDSYKEGQELFYNQATLHIPNEKGLMASYKKKSAWKKFSKIVAE